MRAGLGMVFAIASLCGCSLVYDTDQYFDGNRLRLVAQLSAPLVEGEPEILVLLEGESLVDGAVMTIDFGDTEGEYRGETQVSSDGRLIARAIDVPVLAEYGETDTLEATITVSQVIEGDPISATLRVPVTTLDELDFPGLISAGEPPAGFECIPAGDVYLICTMNQTVLASSYSTITIGVPLLVAVGPVRRIHATRSLTVAQVLAGGPAATLGDWVLGPGAGLGGDVDAQGQPTETGGLPGNSLEFNTRGGGGGGGAGALADGESGPRTSGGAAIGNRKLIPLELHGGGGGGGGESKADASGGVGGSGGGVLWLSSADVFVIRLLAPGQDGDPGADPGGHDCTNMDYASEPPVGGPGGGGGGGSIFVQATRSLIVEGAFNQPVEPWAVYGGQAAGLGDGCPESGRGGQGRIRIDSPVVSALDFLAEEGAGLWRGPTFLADLPVATRTSPILVKFVAQENESFALRANGTLVESVAATPLGVSLVDLQPGLNQLCVAADDSGPDGPEYVSCRQVAYLP